MALGTYNELVEAVAAWPDLQGEPDLQGAIPTLIVLAEAAINNNSELRLRGALADLEVAVPDDTLTSDLPTDCLQVDGVSVDGVPLAFATVDALQRLGHCDTGAYAIDGARLVFDRQQSSYTLRYYQRTPDLATAGTNWLFAKSPDLYLYGALIQAAIFSKESEQESSRYELAYHAAIGRLIGDDWSARIPAGQSLKARVI